MDLISELDLEAFLTDSFVLFTASVNLEKEEKSETPVKYGSP